MLPFFTRVEWALQKKVELFLFNGTVGSGTWTTLGNFEVGKVALGFGGQVWIFGSCQAYDIQLRKDHSKPAAISEIPIGIDCHDGMRRNAVDGRNPFRTTKETLT